MSRRAAVAAIVCGIVGFVASATAAYVHYHLLHDPTYRSFCDINSRISCTDVYLSRYSMYLGVPVAVFGALWFAMVTLLSMSTFQVRHTVRESIPGYLLVLSTAALVAIAYLAYASLVILKTICVLCLTTYLAVIGLLILSSLTMSFPITTLPRRAVHDIRVLARSPIAIVIVILSLVGTVTTLAFFTNENGSRSSADPGSAPLSQDRQSEFERFFAAEPRVPLSIPNEGAKVLIVKFSDFQCPACGQSYFAYKPILAKYEAEQPGAVRMVVKDFPLNPNCNPNVSVMMHPAACDAAVAVRLAAQHNRAEALEDYFYTNQAQLTPDMVRRAARTVGNVSDFDERYQSTVALVRADAILGGILRITQTPTFYVNGVKFVGMFATQYFQQSIEYELQHPR